jgi:hypothetical protein
MTVPEGTTLTAAQPGVQLSETAARLVARGDWEGAIRAQPGLEPRTYLPGATIPNYNLTPLGQGHVVRIENIVISRPMRMSDILKRNMGHCHLAACTALP